jgi:predicted nucleic acid-binding Zn finger protein
MARTAYDPGTPTQPVKVRRGYYSVDSWRGEEKSYGVTLDGGTAICSCPDHQKRQRDCKHIKAARAARYQAVAQKAQHLPTDHLTGLLEQYEGRDLVIAVAIRGELMDRGEQVTA